MQNQSQQASKEIRDTLLLESLSQAQHLMIKKKPPSSYFLRRGRGDLCIQMPNFSNEAP